MTDHSSPLKMKTLCLAIALLSTVATSAHADALQDLKAQVDVLLKKVAELEQKQAAASPANAVTGGATEGSFKLPGSDTSVTLGDTSSSTPSTATRAPASAARAIRSSNRARSRSARVQVTTNDIRSNSTRVSPG